MQVPAHSPAEDTNRNVKFQWFDPCIDTEYFDIRHEDHNQANQSAKEIQQPKPE